VNAPTATGRGAQGNVHPDGTRCPGARQGEPRRCTCPACIPAIPYGRLRDDPETAARVANGAWAAKLALLGRPRPAGEERRARR
jgi:hypothetical protein